MLKEKLYPATELASSGWEFPERIMNSEEEESIFFTFIILRVRLWVRFWNKFEIPAELAKPLLLEKHQHPISQSVEKS